MCKINVIYEHAIHPFIRDQIKVPYRQLQRQSCLSSSLELRASKPIKCPSDVEAKRRILINELQGTARHGRAKHSCTLHIAHCTLHTHIAGKRENQLKSQRESMCAVWYLDRQSKNVASPMCVRWQKKKKKNGKKKLIALYAFVNTIRFMFFTCFFFFKSSTSKKLKARKEPRREDAIRTSHRWRRIRHCSRVPYIYLPCIQIHYSPFNSLHPQNVKARG